MGERLEGTLADWNPAKACGWVESTSGLRLFAHKSEFLEQFNDYASPAVGTPVSFVTGFDAKSGKERAQQISFLGPGGEVAGARLSGRLADWNPAKACGWVEASDGQRLFAHKSEFTFQFMDGAGPTPGTPVTFVVGVDAKSGKERAQQISVIEPPRMLYRQDRMDILPHYGKGAGRMPVNAWQRSGPPRVYGVLAEWLPAKGCGWLECASGHSAKKYFAHKSEFLNQFADDRPPPPGTPVSFAVGIDMKSGKERAQQIQFEVVTPAIASLGHTAPVAQRMLSAHPARAVGENGTLAEWLPEKACGWIESEAGKRYFTHKTEFVEPFEDGGEPPVGTAVSFVIGTDPKSGKQRACQIQIGYGLQPVGNILHGTLMEWKPAKACGWVTPDKDENQKYFAHKSEFVEQFDDGADPSPGTRVTFVVGRDLKSGRERAQEIRLVEDDDDAIPSLTLKRRVPSTAAGPSAKRGRFM